ncbi:hypothetical protein [Streptococcus dysgalactiae]|uniref:Hypothetical membrane spanning protein n=1 Tax=Streptococcus dysgalactiae TaxID=1334 RepID=A0A9X9QNW0_STRDY|nr:hypothetical protein [Streptococcus dysgalactiae]VTS17965.1 hypothetical membrane spanning protein [Streptococcus dysgalactiae subsp. equisimilis]VTS46825.1 hypothetical membrane spanning protein [Streptococcus dysgalactiae subsp. equisimilis]VTS77519.1 hypothetical membrane spanning protein [Streptococcus dysgalactiae]
MKEHKLLPSISLVLSFISLLDHFMLFIAYGYIYLPIIAVIIAILSIFYNFENRKNLTWLALGVSLLVLAVAVYFYYYLRIIPY